MNRIAFIAVVLMALEGQTINQSAERFVITHRDKFYELFNDKSKYLVVALLKRNCAYSEDLMINLNAAIESLKQTHSDLDILVAAYYCENSNFCRKFFDCAEYPELRFYNRPNDPTHEFVRFKRPRKYEADKLAKKIFKRIYPIKIFTDVKFIDEAFVDKMRNKINTKKKKIVYYCIDQMTEKEAKVIKEVMGLFLDIYTIQLENCDPGIETSEPFINKLMKYKKKSILLIKYGHNESAVYDKPITRHNLFNFIQNNKDVRVHKLTSERVNNLFAKREIAYVLFVHPEQSSLIKDFRKFATRIYSKIQMKFYYHITEITGEGDQTQNFNDEGAIYLKRILGVALEDEPAVRIIRVRTNNKNTKYRFEGNEITQAALRKFYDNYIDGELDAYEKTDLPLRPLFMFNLPDYVKPFNEDFSVYTNKEDRTLFVFVMGDAFVCPQCKSRLDEFIDAVNKLLASNEIFLNKIEVQIADILRHEIDAYVNGNLPYIIQVTPGYEKIAKRLSNFHFTQERFINAAKNVLDGKKIKKTTEVVDLSTIEIINEDL